MAIGDQASNDIEETVDRATMASMLNLGDVFKLIDNAFNDGSFAQEELVYQRQQAIFHVFAKLGDELHAKGLKELFKEWLGDIATICDEFTKQAFAQSRNWCAIIHIARRDLASQEFATVVDDE